MIFDRGNFSYFLGVRATVDDFLVVFEFVCRTKSWVIVAEWVCR